MTSDFRKHRDEGLKSLYITLIQSGKTRLTAIEIVYEEQKLKYGLSLESVRRIVCNYSYGRKKKV